MSQSVGVRALGSRTSVQYDIIIIIGIMISIQIHDVTKQSNHI